jgi:hypothetical protein
MTCEKIKSLYYIKDNRTDKIIYIGQTINYKKRIYDHFYYKNKSKIDKHMFEEGRENFSMDMFDIDCNNLTDEELRKKEDELIIQYDTINNGFNKNRSGLISKAKEYYKEMVKKYRNQEKYNEYRKEYEKTEKRKNYLKEYKKKYYQEHKENKC